MPSTKISVRIDFCIYLACLFFLMPLQLVLSWLLSAFIHELFHYIAIRRLRIPVYRLSIGMSGAIMESAPLTCREEIFCAAAGPVGGIVLFFLAKWLPYVALFGLLQSAFNLFPIYPLDGGRILWAILRHYFGGHAERIYLTIEIVIMLLFIILIFCIFRSYRLTIAAAMILSIRRILLKFPCKAC